MVVIILPFHFVLNETFQVMALFVNLVFLGSAFTMMLVYVWSRRNPYIRLNFFGLLNFQVGYVHLFFFLIRPSKGSRGFCFCDLWDGLRLDRGKLYPNPSTLHLSHRRVSHHMAMNSYNYSTNCTIETKILKQFIQLFLCLSV